MDCGLTPTNFTKPLLARRSSETDLITNKRGGSLFYGGQYFSWGCVQMTLILRSKNDPHSRRIMTGVIFLRRIMTPGHYSTGVIIRRYTGSFFALNIFVNIWCALVSRYSYLKKNSYHIWMNHCEHKIHHLTTTFRRNISYFVAYMWCSHRRFKNAVLSAFNASIQFNFSWFLIKWYVLA